MNGPTPAWRRPGLFIGSAAAGLIALGFATVPASAHTPTWSVSCSEVTVDLTAYNAGVTNSVSITADGKDLLATKSFGNSYHDKIALPEHTSPVEVRLVVKAGDGQQFSRDETKTAPVCADQPSTPPSASAPAKPPATPPTTPEPSSTTATAAPVPSSTTATAAPAPSSKPTPNDLAETGSSSTTPIIAGAAAVVVVVGGGIMLAARRRNAAARH